MHRRREPAAAGLNMGAIVTPFLDMSFQILAFFIMTYHPSALEGHVAGSLVPPVDKIIAEPDPTAPAGVIAPHEINLGQSVVVRVTANEVGAPARILVKGPADAAFLPVADERQDVGQGLDRLVARLKEGGAANDTVKIEGDGALRQQYVMQVYDACRRAGAAKVAFVPPAAPR